MRSDNNVKCKDLNAKCPICQKHIDLALQHFKIGVAGLVLGPHVPVDWDSARWGSNCWANIIEIIYEVVNNLCMHNLDSWELFTYSLGPCNDKAVVKWLCFCKNRILCKKISSVWIEGSKLTWSLQTICLTIASSIAALLNIVKTFTVDQILYLQSPSVCTYLLSPKLGLLTCI
jgi:hypothetical protein